MTSRDQVLEAARKMDQVCRELAWWTKPVAPPEELADHARQAIRTFRKVHHEHDGAVRCRP